MSNQLSEDEKTKIFYAIHSSLFNFLVMNIKKPAHFETWFEMLASKLKEIPEESFMEILYNQSISLASNMANNYIFNIIGNKENWKVVEKRAKEIYKEMPPTREFLH